MHGGRSDNVGYFSSPDILPPDLTLTPNPNRGNSMSVMVVLEAGQVSGGANVRTSRMVDRPIPSDARCPVSQSVSRSVGSQFASSRFDMLHSPGRSCVSDEHWSVGRTPIFLLDGPQCSCPDHGQYVWPDRMLLMLMAKAFSCGVSDISWQHVKVLLLMSVVCTMSHRHR